MAFIDNLQRGNEQTIWASTRWNRKQSAILVISSHHAFPHYRLQRCWIHVDHFIRRQKHIKFYSIVFAFTNSLTSLLFFALFVIFGIVKFIFSDHCACLRSTNIHHLQKLTFDWLQSQGNMTQSVISNQKAQILTTFIWGAHVANSRSQFLSVERGATTRWGAIFSSKRDAKNAILCIVLPALVNNCQKGLELNSAANRK